MKKSNNSNYVFDLISRYFILILASINSLWIFYFAFTTITIFPVYFIMGLFFETVWFGDLIITNGLAVEFIKACIAGSAYFLLLILNLSTPNIPIRKRILMILISFASLLVLNVIRIVLLIFVFFYGFYFFDIAHEFFWYFMSTIFVVLIWFLQVWYFKIKETPFYSDLKYLIKKARG